MLSASLRRVRRGDNLNQDEAEEEARTIFDSDLSDQAIAEFLVALADKGEADTEIAGFATEMLRRAQHVHAPEGSIDLCGTGGSGFARFNVSTASAFVAAACGVVVAKHGNRGSNRPNGTFDLLEVLGLPVALTPYQLEDCLAHTGVGFIFAREYHPGMRRVIEARKMAGRRTIFNLAGPLCNPARVSRQLVGTAELVKGRVLANALRLLGREKAIVVYGDPGIDELSISGPLVIFEVRPDGIKEREFQLSEAGIARVDYSEIPVGDCHENAEVFRRLLDNEAPESIRNMIALNAGAALYLTDRTDSIAAGYREALDAIVDGRMKQKFNQLKSYLAQGVHDGTA